jgi:hypothetical protein
LVHKDSKWKVKIKNSASYLSYKAGYGTLRLIQSCSLAHSCHRTQEFELSLLVIAHKFGVLSFGLDTKAVDSVSFGYDTKAIDSLVLVSDTKLFTGFVFRHKVVH